MAASCVCHLCATTLFLVSYFCATTLFLVCRFRFSRRNFVSRVPFSRSDFVYHDPPVANCKQYVDAQIMPCENVQIDVVYAGRCLPREVDANEVWGSQEVYTNGVGGSRRLIGWRLQFVSKKEWLASYEWHSQRKR